MGLYRRGPTWWMSFTYNGRQVRQSTETDDKKTGGEDLSQGDDGCGGGEVV